MIGTNVSRTPLTLLCVLVASLLLGGCDHAVTAFRCTMEALLDNAPLKLQPADTVDVQAMAETEPVQDACDAADDPAIWPNADRPDGSLIAISNKVGRLAVHGMDGATISQIEPGRINNVDIRDGIEVSGRRRIVVAASNRSNQTIDVFELDPATGQLADLLAEPIDAGFEEEVYGLCLYHSAVDGRLYAYATSKEGVVGQWRLDDDGSGRLNGVGVRTWATGVETEACVADDANGWFYLGAENDGIWRYGAEPTAPVDRRFVVDITGVEVGSGGQLAGDVEGLALYESQSGNPGEGYLIASSQGNNTYVVYDRVEPHAHRGTFRIVGRGSIDGAEGTDGIDVVSEPLGRNYPMGLLVVQDGENTNPDGSSAYQNFKLVSWQDVATALDLE